MSAQQVIEEFKALPPAERAQVARFVMEQNDLDNNNWNTESREKIDRGWEQAKSGQLRTPEEAREDLAARKEVWKSRRAQ
jgi:hypothetical protein